MCRSRGGLSANEKEGKNASNYECGHALGDIDRLNLAQEWHMSLTLKKNTQNVFFMHEGYLTICRLY